MKLSAFVTGLTEDIMPADDDLIMVYDADGAALKKVQKSNLIPAAEAGINIVLDGGGAAIAAGQQFDIEIPFDMTIQSATLLADQAGDIVIDLWVDSYANYPPTDADSITASAPPTLSAAASAQDTTLTGWTTALSAGSIMRVNVDSAATVQRVTLSLRGVRS